MELKPLQGRRFKLVLAMARQQKNPEQFPQFKPKNPLVDNQIRRDKPPSASEPKVLESKPPAHPSTQASFQEISVRWELAPGCQKRKESVSGRRMNKLEAHRDQKWLADARAPNEVVVGMTKPYKNYVQDTIQKVLGMRVAIDFTIVADEHPVDFKPDQPANKISEGRSCLKTY